MTASTIVWGVVADALGHCHWQTHERTADGRGAVREDIYSAEPAADYAGSHPSPMEARWCHGSVIGRVISLRRQHGKLLAVAELDEVTPDLLEALTEEYGPLRWSSSTRKDGRGPLVLRECSLTPTPASIGLHPVTWHHAGVSKGNLPAWVTADLKRGRDDLNRRSRSLDVFEADRVSADYASTFNRGGGEWRHDPREVFHSGAVGRVLAVNGRPVRR